jgi:hypothetical protein
MSSINVRCTSVNPPRSFKSLTCVSRRWENSSSLSLSSSRLGWPYSQQHRRFRTNHHSFAATPSLNLAQQPRTASSAAPNGNNRCRRNSGFLQLFPDLLVYFVDRLIIHIEIKRFAIIGFARDHSTLAVRFHMNSNSIGDLKFEIWIRHSKSPPLETFCIDQKALRALI